MLKDKIYNLITLPREIIFKKLFRVWEVFGFHITPVHFYYPIPDTRTLKNKIWAKHSDLIGIDLNLNYQLEILKNFTKLYKKEYAQFPINKTADPTNYYVNNGGFETVDCEIFYCMLRYFKPSNLYEIGSGHSTLIASKALQKNLEEGHKTQYLIMDPFPGKLIKTNFKIIKKRVQDITIKQFEKLGTNDILFIDSSHVINIGGDVLFEILEILPRLKKGVIVHFHDIFLPSNYPKDQVLKSYVFYTEQYLLQAFLTNNNSFEIIFTASYLHLNHSQKLSIAFPSYQKKTAWPASFWIRKIK